MAGGRKSALPVIGERAETLWLLPVFWCHEMDLFLCSVKWFGSVYRYQKRANCNRICNILNFLKNLPFFLLHFLHFSSILFLNNILTKFVNYITIILRNMDIKWGKNLGYP